MVNRCLIRQREADIDRHLPAARALPVMEGGDFDRCGYW